MSSARCTAAARAVSSAATATLTLATDLGCSCGGAARSQAVVAINSNPAQRSECDESELYKDTLIF